MLSMQAMQPFPAFHPLHQVHWVRTAQDLVVAVLLARLQRGGGEGWGSMGMTIFQSTIINLLLLVLLPIRMKMTTIVMPQHRQYLMKQLARATMMCLEMDRHLPWEMTIH